MHAGQPLCSLGALEGKWCNKVSQPFLSLTIESPLFHFSDTDMDDE